MVMEWPYTGKLINYQNTTLESQEYYILTSLALEGRTLKPVIRENHITELLLTGILAPLKDIIKDLPYLKIVRIRNAQSTKIPTILLELENIELSLEDTAMFGSWAKGYKDQEEKNILKTLDTYNDILLQKQEKKILEELEKQMNPREKIPLVEQLLEGNNIGFQIEKGTIIGIVIKSKQLHILPQNIDNLINLQILGLSSNELTSLPESLGQITNLPELRLYNNQLTSLPEIIRQLYNIREIYINVIKFNYLPEKI